MPTYIGTRPVLSAGLREDSDLLPLRIGGITEKVVHDREINNPLEVEVERLQTQVSQKIAPPPPKLTLRPAVYLPQQRPSVIVKVPRIVSPPRVYPQRALPPEKLGWWDRFTNWVRSIFRAR